MAYESLVAALAESIAVVRIGTHVRNLAYLPV